MSKKQTTGGNSKGNKKIVLAPADGETKAAAERMETIKGNASIASMFQSAAHVDPNKYIIKSRSPLIKPHQMPEGQALIGVLQRFIGVEVGSGKDKRVGTLAEFKPQGSAIGYAIPLTAVLRGALEVTGDGAGETTGDSGEAKSPFIGHEVVIQRMADKIPSKKGNDAWNFIVAISPERI